MKRFSLLFAPLVALPLFAITSTPSMAQNFANCASAQAAGVSNIQRGQPGYNRNLDRDNDGFACEEGDPAATRGPRPPAQGTGQPVPAGQPGQPGDPNQPPPPPPEPILLPGPEQSCALEILCLKGLTRTEEAKAKNAGINTLPAVRAPSTQRPEGFRPPSTPNGAAPIGTPETPQDPSAPTTPDGQTQEPNSGTTAVVNTQSTVGTITGDNTRIHNNARVFFSDCNAAREAGAAPLRRGSPGFDRALDRNDNGIACEDGE